MIVKEAGPVRRVALLIGLTLVAAACVGGEADPTTSTSASTTTSTIATTTTTTIATTTTTGPTTTTTLPPARIFPDAVTCNTEFPNFPCSALIDADGQTRWNAADGGVGALLEFEFNPPIQISEIAFDNVTDAAPFTRNARAHWLKITTDDLPGATWVELLDASTPQRVDFPTLATTMVRIEITATYPGQTYEGLNPFDELALADVDFSGYLATVPDTLPDGTAIGRDPADGLSVTSVIDPDRDGRIDDLAFDGDQFLALVRLVNGEGAVWSSPDGLTWERVSVVGWFDTDGGPTTLAPVGEGGLAAAGEHFGTATVWWSADRETWREIPLDPGVIHDLEATPVGVVAVGEGVSTNAGEVTAAWWSADGEAWETTIFGDIDGPPIPLRWIRASSELMIAAGYQPLDVTYGVSVTTSLDGRIWRVPQPDGLVPADLVDLLILDGETVALDPEGPTLWRAAEPTFWEPLFLRWHLAPEGSLATGVELAEIGGRLVVIGYTSPLTPSEDDPPVQPEAWMLDPDGFWVPLPAPDPGEDPVATMPTGAVAGRGRLVVSVATEDNGLGVWVVQPA